MDIDIYDHDNKTADICNHYWEVDDKRHFKNKVSAIAEKFKLSNHQVQTLVKSHCTAFSSETKCCACDEPYAYKNRQDYTAFKEGQLWTCKECSEKIKHQQTHNKTLALNLALERRQKSALDADELSIRQLILLVAFIRHSISEDLSYLHAFNTQQNEKLSPTEGLSLKLIQELYDSNLIAIHPNSDESSIELNENNGFSYYFTQVTWILPLKNLEMQPIDFIESLEKRIHFIKYSQLPADVITLSQEISLHECLAYLEHVLTEHKLPFAAGDKICLALNHALEHFSVAQIYSFIWKAGKDAIAFYHKSAKSRQHAANIVAGNIESQVERALANHWNVNAYGRIKALPQSVVSRTLFETLLKTEDGGFNQVF